jgi:hypothetical protein
MKTKRYFFGLPAVLLALSALLTMGLVLAGCGGEDGDDKGTTGQTTVTGKDIAVTGTDMPDALAEQTGDNGEKFSITGGKLSFTLPAAPANQKALGSHQELLTTLFGNESGGYTATPDDAKFVMVDGFRLVNGGKNYLITKEKTTGDPDSGNATVSKIVYVYADKDVILSRDAKDWTTNSGGMTITYHWDAVNLALKKGWNLVRFDGQVTMTQSAATMNATVKIATADDVSWTIRDN